MMELGACVSLLVKCATVGCKVARLAKVTGGSDCKTFSLVPTCHLYLPDLV